MKSKNLKLLLCGLMIFLNNQCLIAQVGLWSKISLEKKIIKKLDAHLIVQSRMDEIKFPINTYIGEAGLSYQIIKNLELGAYYRYIGRLKKGTYRPYHRYYADLAYKVSIKKSFEFSYRLRYQQQFKDDKEDGIVADKNYWRNKIEVSYHSKSKFGPFLSADIFTREGATTDNIRYKLGTNFKIKKNQSTEIALQADDEKNGNAPTLYRIVLSYKLKF
jgi:Protein of unknown function (DUF2490)